MHYHWPITRTVGAALAAFVVAARLSLDPGTSAGVFTWSTLAWVLAGAAYTHAFEHWWHRVPMHGGLPRLLSFHVSHLEHHRIFCDQNFQTRDPERLRHVVGRAWAFPALFALHFVVLSALLPATAVVGFLFGTTAHYVLFELTHWMTHVENHPLDRALARVPLVSGVRARQIEHHRRHHEIPSRAFNFNPPYLLDRWTGRMPAHDLAPPRVAPVAPAPIAPPKPPTPAPVWVTPRPWLRPLMRYGSVAAVVGIAVVGGVVLAKNIWYPAVDVTPSEQES